MSGPSPHPFPLNLSYLSPGHHSVLNKMKKGLGLQLNLAENNYVIDRAYVDVLITTIV